MLESYVLRVDGIRFRANLGASSSERALPQEIVVDVELTLPLSALPKRDRRPDAVDYDAVAGVVVEQGRSERYRLLETYVQHLIERLLDATPALRIRVAATKLRMPTMHNVDRAVVEIVATRDKAGR
jgi:7,8-dihydroneopterin aldolase/epimerase/oxygenase